MNSTIWLIAVLPLGMIAGCISDGPDPGTTSVEISTSYYAEERYAENEEYGLTPGAPAAGARIVIGVYGSPEDEECRSMRSLVAGQFVPGGDCRYETWVGESGATSFRIPPGADFTVGVIVGGMTPVQPEGCDREYQSTIPGGDWEDFTADLDDELDIMVPFYIVCSEALD